MMLENKENFDNWLNINLDAIIKNWQYRDSLSSGRTKTAAVVKATGDGIGANAVATALASAGCNEFFVATTGEAITLREHLDFTGHSTANIMALHGCNNSEIAYHDKFRIIPVLNDPDQLLNFINFYKDCGEKKPAILHIDTGMNRLGFDPNQYEWLMKNKFLLDSLDCKYVMSHLISAEIKEDQSNRIQLEAFKKIQRMFPKVRASLANSAGCLLSQEYHFEMTRPGIALYGADPTNQRTNELLRTFGWRARILQIRQAKAGETVGYGGTHKLVSDSKIATIGVGYADGYNRKLGGKANVLVGTKVAPVIGRVSMDSITVDVSSIEAVDFQSGTVELVHDKYDISSMAHDADTISYEIITQIGIRPFRNYLIQ